MALETVVTALLNHTVDLAINHAGLQFNDTAADNAGLFTLEEGHNNGSSSSLSSLFDTMQQVNGTTTSEQTPQIPAYIRNTSMVFCIVIMCLGVIGNIMVSE